MGSRRRKAQLMRDGWRDARELGPVWEKHWLPISNEREWRALKYKVVTAAAMDLQLGDPPLRWTEGNLKMIRDRLYEIPGRKFSISLKGRALYIERIA